MMTDSINAAAQELEVWLADPHELGRKPAKVEYVNFFEDNGIRCLIFRYRKSLFGKWLLGIVSDSGTFSEMREYRPETARQDAQALLDTLKNYWKTLSQQYRE
mgnify:FL=1